MVTGVYDQYLFYFGSGIRNCPWGGVAILGTAARPTSDSYYNGSSECVVLVQEPGHNFGMVHSSALRCTAGGVPVPISDGVNDCQHDEYEFRARRPHFAPGNAHRRRPRQCPTWLSFH